MSSYRIVKEMGVRVGLPLPLISEIYFRGLSHALKWGQPDVDLVFMAHAIKYISDNSYHLKPRWRDQIQR